MTAKTTHLYHSWNDDDLRLDEGFTAAAPQRDMEWLITV
ncbi:hypothetical protein USDA257_p06380 (plasmid) [Sinorhizobium fredii USDA 257]|uniref:Uncharacterized protein n=1 Tax=Sinorhizobium fredii (strain USDA 257) TaxID=1185652 RepID=I3XHJ0_SINF2|nr:hypothetical protein USDA257_p06380 [Sinorhizobium fredii USDA 257]